MSPLGRLIRGLDESRIVSAIPLWVVRILLPVPLIVGPVLVDKVPTDIGIAASVGSCFLLARLIFGYKLWFLFLRLLIYLSLAFVLYLIEQAYPGTPKPLGIPIEYIFYACLVAALVAGVRYTKEHAFQLTPTDFLVVIMIVALGLIPESRLGGAEVVPIAIKLVILFYASELVMRNMHSRWNELTISSLWAFVVLTARGWLV